MLNWTENKTNKRIEMIKIYFRFLKENKVYHIMRNHLQNDNFHKKYSKNIYHFFKYYDIKPVFYVIETFDWGIYNYDGLDDKWMIFLYENKLYGTPYTCSKRDLLSYIFEIITSHFSLNKETTKKAIEILVKEKYQLSYLKRNKLWVGEEY